jgi:MEMO1 family protein
MALRAMEFAGAWYPARPEAAERQIRAWWAQPLPPGLAPARLGVAPHAGWEYSGRLAARVFQALLPAPEVALVIVIGGHLRPGDPVVTMVEGEWETPFGPMPVHGGFRDELQALGSAGAVRWETPQRSTADNSTELQLPFARYRYPRAELLPLRAPPGPLALELGRRLADYLERTGLAAVGVASTDLTHYGPAYGFEPKGRGPQALRWVREENDPAFIEAVAGGDGERLLAVANTRHCACSAGAVAALGEVARRHGWRFAALDYATSADVKPGDSHNFVGYLAGVYQG